MRVNNMGGNNRTALITGASRGIGKAIATQLASDGYNVIINYKNSKDKAEQLAKYLKEKFNIKALSFQADVSDEKEIQKLIDFCYENFKSIDILVNNAGICYDAELSDRTVGQFVETFKTNVFSVFQISRIIGQNMVKSGFGKIVNIKDDIKMRV